LARYILESSLKILEVKLIDIDSKNKGGEILEIGKNSITIGCDSGKIEISRVQPKSKEL